MTKSPAKIAFEFDHSRFENGAYVPSKTEQTRDVYRAATETDFFNLKNKAEGARRYGFVITVDKFTNPDGATAFRPEYQTTLNGARYQSSKYGDLYATLEDAVAAGQATAAGALKRYAKLAKTPGSGVEYRDALSVSTTCKIADAADALKK